MGCELVQEIQSWEFVVFAFLSLLPTSYIYGLTFVIDDHSPFGWRFWLGWLPIHIGILYINTKISTIASTNITPTNSKYYSQPSEIWARYTSSWRHTHSLSRGHLIKTLLRCSQYENTLLEAYTPMESQTGCKLAQEECEKAVCDGKM